MDIGAVRRDFPILDTCQHGKPLVYLDNAATMQMPEPVLQAVTEHYRRFNGNVHRGVHRLSRKSTEHLENARQIAADFLGAAAEEIVFTSGTTDGINQLARMISPAPGDQILVSAMEHHSNLLPWQQLAERTGAAMRIIPLDEKGDLDLTALETLLLRKTTVVAASWVSNVLGTVNPVRRLADMAHKAGALLVLDGAQGMRLGKTDVKAMDCDFLAFSGHKLGALTGIGVLYGKRSLLEQLPPAAYGGGMIQSASYSGFVWDAVPQRFEAGTPNYVGAVSLGAALQYLEQVGLEDIARQEAQLTALLEERLRRIPNVQILGRPLARHGAVSLTVHGVHPFDFGVLLDSLGVAVRTGHMCAQPLVEHFGVSSAVRFSPAFYNTEEEIVQAVEAAEQALSVLGRYAE